MKKKADKEAVELGLISDPAESDEEPEVDHPDNDHYSFSDTSIDTSVGTSMGSDFQDIPQEVQSNIEQRIAEEVRMALLDSELPDPRGMEVVSEHGSRAQSIRSVKVPPGKIGIVIDASDDGPIVQEVYPSSPVKGRIYRGDRIVGINGTSVDGMSQEDLVILMASSTDKEREFTIESF